jgi:hypothetical protein
VTVQATLWPNGPHGEPAQGELKATVDGVFRLLDWQLTAYLAGVRDVPDLYLAIEKGDDSAAKAIMVRLRFVLRLADEFWVMNSTDLLRAWLRERDDELDGRPATLIRAAGDTSGHERILTRARAYLRPG